MDPIIIVLLGTAVASLGANVYQAKENRELRKQIEELTLIIQKLQNDINELEKQLKALKIWSFRKKMQLKREIKKLIKERDSYKTKLNRLEEKFKKVA